MKRGIFSSEFWMSIGAGIIASATPQLNSAARVISVGVIAAVYTIARTFLKSRDLSPVISAMANANAKLADEEVPAISPERSAVREGVREGVEEAISRGKK